MRKAKEKGIEAQRVKPLTTSPPEVVELIGGEEQTGKEKKETGSEPSTRLTFTIRETIYIYG